VAAVYQGIRTSLEWRAEGAESSARTGTFGARLLPGIRIPRIMQYFSMAYLVTTHSKN
jgi:hypothetical protein